MKIMEVSENKLDSLKEIAEKMVKCGEKLLECIHELTGKYSERRYGGYRRDWDDRDYNRYF